MIDRLLFCCFTEAAQLRAENRYLKKQELGTQDTD